MNRLRRAALDASAVLLPVRCAGCDAPDRAVCEACVAALDPAPHRVTRRGLELVAGLVYDGAVRRVIGAFKDGGRTDVARSLAPALRAAISAALAATEGRAEIEFVVVPPTATASRARGYRPVDRVLALAGFRAARVLHHVSDRRDQVGLGRDERRENLVSTLGVRGSLRGRRFLFIDDILTTGATAVEVSRAVRAAGGEVVGGAVIAETPLRHARPEVKR